MQIPKIIEQFPVVAPVMHLLVSAIFLTGYATGFGAGIGGLFGISDLFSLSLSDLALVYVGSLILPFVIVSSQLRPDYVSLGTRLSSSADPSDHNRLRIIQKSYKWFVRFIFAFWLLNIVPFTFLAWKLDERIPYDVMSGVVAMSVSLGWMKYAQKLPTTQRADLIISLILSLLAGAFMVGLMRGQGERRYDISYFKHKKMECQGMVIIRPIGVRFLAVDDYSNRYIINDDCKKILSIPTRKIFRNMSLADMASEWWILQK